MAAAPISLFYDCRLRASDSQFSYFSRYFFFVGRGRRGGGHLTLCCRLQKIMSITTITLMSDARQGRRKKCAIFAHGHTADERRTRYDRSEHDWRLEWWKWSGLLVCRVARTPALVYGATTTELTAEWNSC